MENEDYFRKLQEYILDDKEETCRICLQESAEKFISPCSCKGTLRYVHRSCLQQWLDASKRRSCEICSVQFRVDVKQRYQWWQSILPWMAESEIRNLILSDALILFFVSLLSLLSMFISFLNLQYERNLPFLSKYEIFWITASSVTIIICAAILYILAFVSIIKPKVKHWYNWWRSNITVTLLSDSESDVNVMEFENQP